MVYKVSIPISVQPMSDYEARGLPVQLRGALSQPSIIEFTLEAESLEVATYNISRAVLLALRMSERDS